MKSDFSIPKNQHENVMSSFWSMMMELESKADYEKCPLQRHFVEGYFRQWNSLMEDNKKPAWIRRTE